MQRLNEIGFQWRVMGDDDHGDEDTDGEDDISSRRIRSDADDTNNEESSNKSLRNQSHIKDHGTEGDGNEDPSEIGSMEGSRDQDDRTGIGFQDQGEDIQPVKQDQSMDRDNGSCSEAPHGRFQVGSQVQMEHQLLQSTSDVEGELSATSSLQPMVGMQETDKG